MNLAALLFSSAQRSPAAVAVVDRGASLTYAELLDESTKLAKTLANLGIERGDRVGLYLEKSCSTIAAIFAILQLGATYVPIDPAAPAGRVRYLAENCQVKGLVSTRRKLASAASEWLEGAVTALLSAPDLIWVPAPETPPRESSEPVTEELAYILYTSGSTGDPKGVMVSHSAALAFVKWAAEFVGLGPSDHVSSHAPFHFDLSVFDIFASVMVGATVVLVPSEIMIFPRSQVQWIAEQRISVWYSVPLALSRMVTQGGMERFPFDSLRQIIFAGEVFPLPALRALQRALPGATYQNFYGPTESNVCAAYTVGRLAEDCETPIPIGSACAGDEIAVVDAQGRLCQVNEVGELWVRGPTLMSGYWGKPELTARAFALLPELPGSPFYRTGDFVVRDTAGTLHFRGRRDAQIKIRGYRVELGEIEVVLERHPAVLQAAVVPLASDDKAPDSLRACVVLKNTSLVSPQTLNRHCAQYLPPYMVPTTVEIRAQLPTTANGKLDRLSLGREFAIASGT